MKYLKPIIERRLENPKPEAATRVWAAKQICDFFETGSVTRKDFYDATRKLLDRKESKRILLYLPFDIMEGAPEDFRRSYVNAWYDLLSMQDVRENFHIGDCLELRARPASGLERVVKCAHLVPWLFKYGYLRAEDVFDILKNNQQNLVLLQSFQDTWPYIAEKGLLSVFDLMRLSNMTAHLPARKPVKPLFVTRGRQQWLDGLSQEGELLNPNAKLSGPFSENVAGFEPFVETIVAELTGTEVMLLGGSLLKGYGTTSSDLDIHYLKALEMDTELFPGSPHATHFYFDSIMIGGPDIVDHLNEVSDRIENIYAQLGRSEKRFATERLEADLLQYRLLHKGFQMFYRQYEIAYREMEGEAADGFL